MVSFRSQLRRLNAATAHLVSAFLVASLAMPALAQDFITVASTTSTEHSGFFDHIRPLLKAETGIELRVIAQGTGQALETGRRGDADVLFVHAREQEEEFVAQGHGVARVGVMQNDFVIIGPASDPAGVGSAQDAVTAMRLIAEARAIFASRGDDIGTHIAEQALWAAAGIVPEGAWYLSTGSGMGGTLNTAAQLSAYLLADRATWLAFGNRGALEILFEGDPVLLNPYGVILVNPDRHPHVKADLGQVFIDWITSQSGRRGIESFLIDGQQVFVPDDSGQP